MMDEALQHRLSGLVRGETPLSKRSEERTPARALLPPGEEIRTAEGTFYLVERSLDEVAREEERSRIRLPEPPWSLEEKGGEVREIPRPLFLDLETTGFTACPLFLAATIDLERGTVRQRFARDYTEEKAVVAATAEEIAEAGTLVTYNGRSYDFPFLRNRAAYHRLRLVSQPPHLDLLHVCRRVWKGRLSDFRLQTVEKAVGRGDRTGDVPGAEIPALYHDYVRRGGDPRIGAVIRHNLKDVLTLVRIFSLLAGEKPERRKRR
jgi:uncharacterized protein YprB with RNaseH-like and TPR domain